MSASRTHFLRGTGDRWVACGRWFKSFGEDTGLLRTPQYDEVTCLRCLRIVDAEVERHAAAKPATEATP